MPYSMVCDTTKGKEQTMNDYKRTLALIFVTVSLILASFCSGIVFGRVTSTEPTPVEGQVNDKCEVDGRCYVQTWIEVSVEDYIGLEVGDEFEVTK